MMTRRELLAALPISMAVKAGKAAEPAFERIDTHTHMHRSAPAMLAALEKANWRCLSICDAREVDDQPSVLAEMIAGTKVLHKESKGRIPWATTFDARPFERPDFADRVIAGLRSDFDQEAIACKIWKNVGMWHRTRSGEFLMPDSKVLTPILEAIEKSGKTLITHLAEPDAAWAPVAAGYYKDHPEWHMYGKSGYPSKESILEARDRMIARRFSAP